MIRCLESEDWSLNLINLRMTFVNTFLKTFWIKTATLAQIVSVSFNPLDNSIW